VLEGEFTVYVGEQRLALPAGAFAFGPKGVPHTFIGETEGAKALIDFQPFQFEGFLREVGEPATERVLPQPLEAPPDMARLIPIAERNGSLPASSREQPKCASASQTQAGAPPHPEATHESGRHHHTDRQGPIARSLGCASVLTPDG
jgi:Cupin domain